MKKSNAVIFGFLIVFSVLFCVLSAAFCASVGGAKAGFIYNDTDVFAVRSAEDYVALSALKDKDFSGKTIRLYADIDVTNIEFTFGDFDGDFDGNGHVLSGATKRLFSKIKSNGRINDLIFADCDLTDECALCTVNFGYVGGVSLYGGQNAATVKGVVGENAGTVEYVSSFLTVTFSGDTFRALCGKQTPSGSLSGSGFYGSVLSTKSDGEVSVFAFCSQEGGSSSTVTDCTFAADVVSAGADVTFGVYNQYCSDCAVLCAFDAPSFSLRGYYADVFDFVYTDGTLSQKVSYDSLSDEQKAETVTVADAGNQLLYADDEGFAKKRVLLDSSFGLNGVSDCYTALFEKTGTTETPVFGAPTVRVYDADKQYFACTPNNLGDKLGDGFLKRDGVYPVVADVLPGRGTQADPFVIETAEVLFRLRSALSFGGTVYVELSDNIDVFSANNAVSSLFSQAVSTANDLSGVPTVCLNLLGNGYTVYPCTALFCGGFSVTGDDFLTTTFGEKYGYVTGETQKAVTPDGDFDGNGTQSDPYVLESAAHLVSFIQDETKNAPDKYAVFGRHIVVNSQKSHGNKLGLSEKTLLCELDGCGYGVLGLADEPLLGQIGASGCLKNVRMDVYGERKTDGIVCLENSGRIEKVLLVGTQSAEAAFVSVNGGAIEKSVCELVADYAFFATDNGGTCAYCINNAPCAHFSGDSDGIRQCISMTTQHKYQLINGEITDEREAADYIALQENGFDADVFAYECGSASLPVLREKGGVYKTENTEELTVPETVVFDETYTYTAEDFTDADVVFDFTATVSGQPADDATIHNAGTYTLTFFFEETTDTLPRKETRTMTITKKSLNSPTLQNVDFAALNLIYTGAGRTAAELTPSGDAFATLTSDYGFSATFAYTKNSSPTTPEDMIGAGEYYQTMTVSSRNYSLTQQSRNRLVTIAKKTVVLHVDGEKTTEYDSDASFGGFTVSAETVGRDEGVAISVLIGDGYDDFFVCSYQKGDNAGSEYTVSYDVGSITLDDYILTTEGGRTGSLTVVKAPIEQGDIVFYGATKGQNGAFEKVYDGQETTLLASGVPTGVTCSYENNVVKNYGVYSVKAIIGDESDNYIPLELTVNASVAKKQLSFTANDVEKEYGYAINAADFTYVYDGLCEESPTSAGLSVTAFPQNLTAAQVPEKGTYIIKITVTGSNPNYAVMTTDGELTITKISLTKLFENNKTGQKSNFDDATVTYSGEKYVRTIDCFSSEEYLVSYRYLKNGVEVSTNGVTNAGTYVVEGTVTPKNDGSSYKETIYTCALVIERQTTKITLSKTSYEYPYVVGGGTDYHDEKYFPYTTDIPTGGVVNVFFGYSEAVHAGTYIDFITYRYVGDENHSGCEVSATLTVAPLAATVSWTREYEYEAEGLYPVLISATDGEGNAYTELTSSSFSFSYVDKFGTFYDFGKTVRAAGKYTMTIRCDNTDYVPTETEFEVEIVPITIEISFGTSSELSFLTFTYGTTGEYNYVNPATGKPASYYISAAGDFITYKNFPIPGTTDTIDLRFRLSRSEFSGGYFDAETYTLSESLLEMPSSFRFVFASGTNNKVTVLPRELKNVWYRRGKVVSGEVTLDYIAAAQNGDFSCKFFDGETEVDAATTRYAVAMQNDKHVSADLVHAGKYTLRASVNNKNYSLAASNAVLSVVIRKAVLQITVAKDMKVKEREVFSDIRYTFSPELIGIDKGKDLTELDGAVLTVLCDYNGKANVGETFGVGIDFSSTDYDAIVVGYGKLTVVSNVYPEYVLASRTFTYDGTYHTLSVGTTIDGVAVAYSYDGDGKNVGRINVGTYLVTATVTYPTGRVSSTSARMTIKKATPVIDVVQNYALYRAGEETLLRDDMILASAVFEGTEKKIPGRFTFGEPRSALQNGDRTYKAKFIPDDTANIETVDTVSVPIRSFRVDSTMIRFKNKTGYSLTSDGISISERVTAELDTSSVPFVADRLFAYQDGLKVSEYVFRKEGEVTIEIRFDDETAYKTVWKVNVKQEETDEPTGKVGVGILSLTSVMFDGDVCYVRKGGGIIKLKPEYDDKCELYINGSKVGGGGMPVSERDTRIVVQIKYNHIDAFLKEYTVREWVETGNEGGSTENGGGGLPTYAIVLISVGGGLILLLGLSFLILRKKLFR